MPAKQRAPRRKQTAALSNGLPALEMAEVSRMSRALAKSGGNESRSRLSGGAFNVDRVTHVDVAKASGGPPDEEL